jgi:hypothetical protein
MVDAEKILTATHCQTKAPPHDTGARVSNNDGWWWVRGGGAWFTHPTLFLTHPHTQNALLGYCYYWLSAYLVLSE